MKWNFVEATWAFCHICLPISLVNAPESIVTRFRLCTNAASSGAWGNSAAILLNPAQRDRMRPDPTGEPTAPGRRGVPVPVAGTRRRTGPAPARLPRAPRRQSRRRVALVLPAHLTASMVILDPAGGRPRWSCTAGSTAGCSREVTASPVTTSVAAAALREAVEETGLAGYPSDAADHVVPPPCALRGGHASRRPVPRHRTGGREPVVSEESHDVRWFPVTDLPRELASGSSRAWPRVAALATPDALGRRRREPRR